MRRRGRIGMTGFALLGCLLPGCMHLFGSATSEDTKDKCSCKVALLNAKKDLVSRPLSQASDQEIKIPEVTQSEINKKPEIASLGNSTEVDPSEHPSPLANVWQGFNPDKQDIVYPLNSKTGNRDNPVSLYPFINPAVQMEPPTTPQVQQPALPQSQQVAEPSQPKMPEKKEALLVALDKFLRDEPKAALECLRNYDPDNQEVFVGLLPVLAQMTQKPLKELNREEVAILFQQLDGLMACMRGRTDLLIEQMCYCKEVKSFGEYESWPEDHLFRAKTGQQFGDPVQIYVQLRNPCSEQHKGGFETKLCSSVKIIDAQGVEQWFHDFTGQDGHLLSRTIRHDHFFNFSFYVPHLEPGSYTLTVEIRDVTRPASPRTARRSLPFRVRT